MDEVPAREMRPSGEVNPDFRSTQHFFYDLITSVHRVMEEIDGYCGSQPSVPDGDAIVRSKGRLLINLRTVVTLTSEQNAQLIQLQQRLWDAKDLAEGLDAEVFARWKHHAYPGNRS